MKFNALQQQERIANGLGSLALAADMAILIALAVTAGWIPAVAWAALSTWGAVIHYKNVMSLANPLTEKDLFTTSGEVRLAEKVGQTR